MQKIFNCTFFIFILLTGCKKNYDLIPKADSKDSTQLIQKKDSEATDSSEFFFEGFYTHNPNVNSFLDCKSPYHSYLITEDSGKLSELYKKVIVTPNVYATVYAKLKGHLIPTEKNSLTEKYPNTLIISDVIAVEKKNINNLCVPYDFWISGYNPEWTLEISDKENLIEFNVIPEKKAYYFFYAEPKEEDGAIVYENHNEVQKYTIKVMIRKEECTASEENRIFDYSAEVILNGDKTFKGCAVKGR